MIFKSFSSPYKYRDLIVLRHRMELEGGGLFLGTRSVLHNAAPEIKDNVRAVMFSSGYILTPLAEQEIEFLPSNINYPQPSAEDSQACLLTFIGQMDRESVRIAFQSFADMNPSSSSYSFPSLQHTSTI